MKTNTFALCSLLAALALSGYRSAYSDEPTPPKEPEPVPVTTAVESEPLTPRQEVALNATVRLDQLDDAVAELKVRCDEKSNCSTLAGEFKKVAASRFGVLTALTALRDPEIGFDATANAVRSSLTELDVAIQSLTHRVGELARPVTLLSSQSVTIVAARELRLPTK